MTGTLYSLEVRPTIPERLARLEELANDLFYSWSSQTRSLFLYLDAALWETTGHNPKLFLKRVSQERLDEVEHDHTFIESYNRALAEYDTYMSEPFRCLADDCLSSGKGLVGYFCFEFGFHESVPIYSGGLGILAGDHCKAASDLGIPLVAVGLLYQQGYFSQEIDRNGQQVVRYPETDFSELLVSRVLKEDGAELHVCVPLWEREVAVRVWEAKAGRIRLLLLDSNVPENNEDDRAITRKLYGGEQQTRVCQEIVLGVGGVRALRALGLKPTVCHINEGHAAFQIIERCREHVVRGMSFDAALELVAAGTVFTTHTPVAAGHDIFDHHLLAGALHRLVEGLGIDMARLFALGHSPGVDGRFNMTALALRGSRFHNGVSRIHGDVASRMESYVWPEIPPAENPVGYVTNGVHLATFLSSQWRAFFDINLGGKWRNELLNPDYWSCIDELPDYAFWSTRQALQSDMLKYVRQHAKRQFRRNGFNPVEIDHLTHLLDPRHTDVLILGFARRFATYKRATLLFRDIDRLARIVNDPERPVLLLFAGKAHPSDEPGQSLIREIHDISMRPEFLGKVLLLEDYNLALGRWLVTGVDVWLNTPAYPLEASGTSGQKAGMNGVINLSVLDGWWGEGYEKGNGWAIRPDTSARNDEERDSVESRALLDILEEQVVPLYYNRDADGYSERWVKMSKASMRSALPRFNAARMLNDYARNLYIPAMRKGSQLGANGGEGARELAEWKTKVLRLWEGVEVRRIDKPPSAIRDGETVTIRVGVKLNRLQPGDLVVECLSGRRNEAGEFEASMTCRLEPEAPDATQDVVFCNDFLPQLPGLQHYAIRAYPYHRLLSHPLEVGRMRWL
ncbi:MAG: alpha-glucan family phosphorylase [Pseudomonadota bacterium]|nr:alpha-glucan family phosphorylase [Pseudomonadota bacterium]